MSEQTSSSYSHTRKAIYKITRNEKFSHHFFISPNLIYEKELLFVYNDGSNVIQKKIPVADVIKHATVKKFFGRDPKTLKPKYRGFAYEIPSHVIENFKC